MRAMIETKPGKAAELFETSADMIPATGEIGIGIKT